MTTPYPADRAYPADSGAYAANNAYAADRPTSADPADEVAETSVGELIGNISNDLSQLFRQEVELAKAELKQEASKAGKAAGMLGGAGFAAYLAVVLLSFALVFALSNVMDPGWAALIVAVIWAIIGAVLYANGRKKLKNVDPVPRRTVDTIKEDAQWLKNPTS
jgi:Putative Actinobacterial Holin-X, holin superfamily III